MGCNNFCQTLCHNLKKMAILMLWKNLTLKHRHKFQTLANLFAPTLLYLVLYTLYLMVESESPHSFKNTTVFYPSNFVNDYCSRNEESFVYLTSCKSKQTCRHDNISSLASLLAEKIQLSAKAIGESCILKTPDLDFETQMLKIYPSANRNANLPFPYATDDFPGTRNLQVLYTPETNLTRLLVEHIERASGKFQTSSHGRIKWGFRPIESEEELLKEYSAHEQQDSSTYLLLGGVVFDEDFDFKDGTIPSLSYKIRFGIGHTFQDTRLFYPQFQGLGPGVAGSQYRDFVMIQTLLDFAYIEAISNVSLLPESESGWTWIASQQEMPYPPYKLNEAVNLVGSLLPLFTILSFCFIIPPLLKRIVDEKKTGTKELMKLMGLHSGLHWLCWVLDGFLTSTVTVLVMVLIICVSWGSSSGSIIQNTSPWIVLIFLLLYTISLILFLFASSTFFTSPNIALSVSILVHLVSFFLPVSLIKDPTSMALSYKLTLSLFPNINLWLGINLLISEEVAGVGVRWHNLFNSHPGSEMGMGHVWIMFILSTFIFCTVTWYIDNVNPGEYGVPKKWYFIFQVSYWRGFFWTRKSEEHFESIIEEQANPTFFEKEPEGIEPGIVVRNLVKVFKGFREKDVTAVDNISFSAYKTEITALLGHNGAGKTTTMSILSGMFPPTRGFAKINGYFIDTQMSQVRKSLGLCPQHDMLFSDLTPYEHLIIFSMIKGLSWKNAALEADRYIKALELDSKRNVKSSNLSGGMKRKVHLGIALVGASKIVLLDEPTSGMDPEARRVVWDLLQKEKKERSILLTTHFMEEADILGDNVAIMLKGKIHCYGSPLFLKRKFGDGYTLNVTQGPNCNINRIKNLVKEKVPGSSLSLQTIRDLAFNLPDTQTRNFPQLFETLEQNRKSLDFLTLNLSATTLEDVFLRVGKFAEEDESKILPSNSLDSDKSSGKSEFVNSLRYGGVALLQLNGLLAKRFIFAKRKYFQHIFLSFLPILMSIIAQVVLMDSSIQTEIYPPLKMNLADYKDTIVFYQSDFKDSEIEDVFKAVVPSAKIIKTTDVMTEILESASKDIEAYRNNIVIAAKLKQLCLTVLLNSKGTVFHGLMVNETVSIYNSVANHARPLSQNIMSNLLLKLLSKSPSEKRKTEIINHPIPASRLNEISDDLVPKVSLFSFLFGITFGTGVLIFSSIFIIFPVTEKLTGAKQLQLMTGVNPYLFWFSNFCADGFLYVLSISVSLVFLLTLDQRETFITNGSTLPFMLIMFLFGISCIVLSYTLSFLSKSTTGGFTLVLITHILFGVIAPVIVWILGTVSETKPSLLTVYRTIRYIFSLCPSFNLVRSIMAIVETSGKCCKQEYVATEFAICGSFGIECHQKKEFFTWDDLYGINIDLISLLLDIILFSFLLFMFERGILKRFKEKIRTKFSRQRGPVTPFENDQLDHDVKLESLRIESGFSDDVLRVNKLVKYFGNLRAINNLSFGVARNECFGLLGINGAGKTTTFRILTGDEICTSGSALLLKKDLVSDRKEFLRMIGYCPQFDSIIDVLTGREMLVLLSKLRGIKNSTEEANRWLKALDLKKDADRPCGKYSGGNKRKLNVGLALVGNPPILFLDEPTTGVDPAGRRQLWEIIRKVKSEGQSVVLTSHSMEECEALCDKLGIMVNGQFKCFGTTRHLKSKFGQGFTILVKLDTRGQTVESSIEILQKLKDFTLAKFPGRVIKDEHKDYLNFHIPEVNIPWSYLFITMEGAKQLFSVETVIDYSVRETSLEEVFINFAKHQRLNSLS